MQEQEAVGRLGPRWGNACGRQLGSPEAMMASTTDCIASCGTLPGCSWLLSSRQPSR